MARNDEFITASREAATDFWEVINKLRALRQEYDAMDYATALQPGIRDGAIDNSDIVPADVTGLLVDVLDAIEAAFKPQVRKKLAKMLRSRR